MKPPIVVVVFVVLSACQGDGPGPATAGELAMATADAAAHLDGAAGPEQARDGAGAATDQALPRPTRAGSGQAVETRSGDQEAQAQERRVVFIDVRRPDEWAQSRVKGAIHIPYTELPQRLEELEEHRDAELVLYCRTGRRSGIALDFLRRAGFERLHNGGGLSNLARQGVPVVR